MDVEQVTAIYEFAASQMVNEGHWNKPKTAAQLAAHHMVLEEVPFEAACMAVWYILNDDLKWPTPAMIRSRAHELCVNWDVDRLMFHRGDEVTRAKGMVEQIAFVAAQDKFETTEPAPKPALTRETGASPIDGLIELKRRRGEL